LVDLDAVAVESNRQPWVFVDHGVIGSVEAMAVDVAGPVGRNLVPAQSIWPIALAAEQPGEPAVGDGR
jgi:hypothetical protein